MIKALVSNHGAAGYEFASLAHDNALAAAANLSQAEARSLFSGS